MFKYVKFIRVETEFTVLEFKGRDDKVKVNHFDVDVVSLSANQESDIDSLIALQAVECETITKDEFKLFVANTAQLTRIKTLIDEKFSSDVAMLTTQYPTAERETWNTQLSQAKAYKESGNEADAQFLKALADAENDTVDNFATAVITKANEYESFMAFHLVNKRAYEKKLMSEIGL